jgi:putative OmpL-like beta-barrel porin-2
MVRFALRGEYFNDPEGARTVPGTSVPTGTAVAIPGGKQFWEITPTLQVKPFYKYKPFDNFIVRLEYRHDQSNTAVFQENNGDLRKGQDTAAAEFMYYFGY